MGTDIHCYVEHQNPDGSWTLPTAPNPYYDSLEARAAKVLEWYPGDENAQKRADALADEEDWDNREVAPIAGYSGRNYGLFAILADVRNGRGFAGVKIGEPTKPIDEPRGVPEDASPEYVAEVETWGGDGHSHSWFTLAELMAYDWDGNYAINSYVAHPQSEWRASQGEEPLPADFDFDAWAIEVELVLNTEGQAAAYARWPRMGMCGGVSGKGAEQWRRVSWKVSHREQAGPAWFEFLDGLKCDDPEKVRVAFFFDN